MKYTVKGGDTLSGILKRMGVKNYNDPKVWASVKTASGNPNLIRPGESLNLSSVPGLAQPKATTTAARTTQTSTGGPTQSVIDTVADKIKPSEEVFSQDVLSQDTWRSTFDNWTHQFVGEYMEPEWQENVYNPAMKDMSDSMNASRNQVAQTGSWRWGGAHNALSDMATDFSNKEQQLRTDFNDQTTEYRDAMWTGAGAPLYQTLMNRWMDSPTRNLNLEGLTSDYDIPEGFASQIGGLGNWDPTKTSSVPQHDWGPNPAQVGMGTNLFSQYIR